MNILDKMIGYVAPQWGAKRARARLAARHYESASFGRRTDGWSRRQSDANAAASGPTLRLLRAQARDLVRNNAWARNGLRGIVADVVGWGIRPRPSGRGAARAAELWRQWGETRQCDAAGRVDFYGLQALVMRCVAESGECLIRMRARRPDDGLAIPLQLQVMEPDLLDTERDGIQLPNGGSIVQGIELDAIGRRAAYWLFDRHPGANSILYNPISNRIPADQILHVYVMERPGQLRGPSWFASVDLRLHDFADYEDATLMKQKIAACMAVILTDPEGGASASGIAGVDSTTGHPTDELQPGMILTMPPGKSATVTNPPQSSDHESYTVTQLRAVAAGLGIPYERLSGDYSKTSFSSARMARLAYERNIEQWVWHLMVSQFCTPVWDAVMDIAQLAGEEVAGTAAEWAPPPMPMLEPDKEGLAYMRLQRIGAITWDQMVRSLGYDPATQLKEIAAFNAAIDKLGIVLDGDPRNMTTSGQLQGKAAAAAAPKPAAPAAAPAANENDDPESDPPDDVEPEPTA
jgi:lambda family phage portal protein